VLAAVLPSLQLGEGTGSTGTSGLRYSLLETSASLDEGVQALKRAMGFIVKLAEMEACIRELLDWISLRKRQINRIQYQAIPEIDATIRYIELILEETERQDAIRIRVLQSKRKERRERLRE
jgi:H(+)-transporting ATP synthase subunit D